MEQPSSLDFLLEQVARLSREQHQLHQKNLEPCCVSPVSSRVCERGVTGCVAKHVQEET